MKTFLLGFAALILALAAYLMFWPVPVDPAVWEAPESKGYTGDFAPNTKLADLELLDIGDIHGPEDIVIRQRKSVTVLEGSDEIIDSHTHLELYVSSQEGKIVRINPDMSVDTFAETGGVPLGMEMDANGNLIVADAYRGLLSVAEDGTVTTLTDEVDGTPILYADDLDIAPSGVIYFSDASTKFGAEAAGSTMAGSLLEIIEHGRTGRLLAYDPASGETSVVADGFSFSNGVAMGPDGNSVIMNETGRYRVLRIWVEGPRKGETDVLIDNLPGFPDNINRGRAPDTFLVGIISQRSAFLDDNDDNPGMRKLALRLPQWMQPKAVNYGLVFEMDADGNVLRTWQDPEGAYPQTTGAVIAPDGYMYITSLSAKKLGRTKFE